MDITITMKIKLEVKLNSKEEILLKNTLNTYTLACNFVSDYIFKTHDLKQASLNKALYYELRDKFNLKAQMAQSVLKTVISKYKTNKENGYGWIKPNFKKPQYDLVWNRDYSLLKDKDDNDIFSINTLEGRKKFSFYNKFNEKYFTDTYKFGTAKLVSKNIKGITKYYLHIPITFYVEETNLNKISNIVGIDRGIRFIITSYDSKGKTNFISGKWIKQKRAHYKKLREELQSKHTSSARKRLKAIGSRENRWMQDVNHCISKALVESYDVNTLFVLEDLSNIRKVTTKVRLKDRYVFVSWSYYDLEEKIKYKALERKQMVINVDPAYTSRVCPKCGHNEKGNRLNKIHTFKCKNCGYISNDDRIAAMNLYRKGLNYIEENL